MEGTQVERGNGTTERSPLVMVRSDDGFRVYSPANPGKAYTVSGSPENPMCSCPEFQNGSRGEYCAHIGAVLKSFGNQNGDRYEREERAAIQGEGAEHGAECVANGTQMLVKRSVSPDGRIDSLSIEFSTAVDDSSPAAIETRANRLLGLQSAIVKGFLDGAKNGNGTRPATVNHDGANGAALAEMVGIGGMDGKWGRRLFIRIQANGQTLRLFGSKTQLADAIKNAGFARMAERIEEGAALRVPCRVITKASPDGKYLNVERVFPVQLPESNGRASQ